MIIYKLVYPFVMLDLWTQTEVLGVAVSGAITLYIYMLCLDRGWLEELAYPHKKRLFYVPMLATFAATIACFLTVGWPPWQHLLSLTAFFAIFVYWDCAIRHHVRKRHPDHAVTLEIMERTRSWLLYVDIPTPVFFWLLYLFSRLRHVPADFQRVFLSGAIGAILFVQGTHWVLDCMYLGAAKTEANASS